MADKPLYERRTFTREIAEALVAEHGTARNAAKIIAPFTRNRFGGTVAPTTIADWFAAVLAKSDSADAEAEMRRATAKAEGVEQHPILENAYSTEDLNRLAELLRKANVPVDAVKSIDKVNLKSYGVFAKVQGDDGKEKIETKALHSTSLWLSPKWEDGPAWPIVQPAAPTKIAFAAPTIIIPKGLRVEFIDPDTQIGFMRNLDSRTFDGSTETYQLDPMHDEDAIDVSLQILGAVQPDGYTQVGDLLDMSEFSKYLQVEEFFRTTQASIDRGHTFLAERAAAMGNARKGRPKKKMRLVAGNHDPDRRLGTALQANARAAYGLRPAMATPESWPLLSTPQLLRLDEIGVEYAGNWPGSEAWLVEGENGLVVIHDPQRKGFFSASVVAGHSHHFNASSFTIRTPFGERTHTLYEIGCLCSLKRVKSKTSLQRTRVPSDRGWVKDWVQGVAVVEILESTGQHRLDFIPIHNGVAMYQGQIFESRRKPAAA